MTFPMNVAFLLPTTILSFLWNVYCGQDAGKVFCYLIHGKCHESISILLCPHWIVGFILPATVGWISVGSPIGAVVMVVVTFGIPYALWMVHYSRNEEELQGLPLCACLRTSNSQRLNVRPMVHNAQETRGHSVRLRSPFEKMLIIKKTIAPGSNKIMQNNASAYDENKSFRSSHPKTDIVCRNFPKVFPIQVPVDEEPCVMDDLSVDANSEESSIEVCIICMEDYQVGEEIGWSKNRQCHHVFHKECILKWLKTRRQCPICRNSYDDDEEMG